METQIAHPPRTAMEVFKILPEGTLAEVINNQLFMGASPFGQHQRMLKLLLRKLDNWVEQNNWGELLFAPMDVYLDETANAVQPDILILQHGGTAFVHDKGFVHGSPAVIIEILSEGNQDHDRIVKKKLYEKFGVQEYFTVDPESKETIHYVLRNGNYIQLETTTAVLRSHLLNADIAF